MEDISDSRELGGAPAVAGHESAPGRLRLTYPRTGPRIGPKQRRTRTERQVLANILKNAIARCHSQSNSNFRHYGGRGIRVAAAWRGEGGLERFVEHMGPRPEGHTLDRIDNDGHYEPGNVRWATQKRQANNRRTSRVVEAFGESLTVAEWARRTGISASCIYQRLTQGWPEERAVSEPSRRP